MERESFVFYKSWLEAIKNLLREMQGEVLTAIIEYGLYGETTESLKPITNAMLAMVIPQINANNRKFENGLKGGRPPKGNQDESSSKPNNNQTITKSEPKNNQNQTTKEPSQNQMETKVEPNVYDNDNVNDNKKESANADKKEDEPYGSTLSPKFLSFQAWIKDNAPYCANPKNMNQITEKELDRLMETYTEKQIADVISQIENRKDKRKQYSSLYRTVLNWIKTEKQQ